MPRFLTLIAVTALLGSGCQDQTASVASAPKSSTVKPVTPGPLSPRRALSLSGKGYARALGPHRMIIKATTRSTVAGYATREVLQQMTMQVAAKETFHVRKDTHEQYGQEVILNDGWLYTRLRHSKFVRRRPRQGEAGQILDRLASHLPDHAELLGRFLKLEAAGPGKVEGRSGTRQRLSLTDKPLPIGTASTGPARRWRSSVAVTALSGEILFDDETGAPLSVDLKARLTFKAPRPGKVAPASGIPAVMSDKLKGTMTLSLTQRVDRLGKVGALKAPPAEDTVTDVRRRRLDYERQLFSGERTLPEDWSPEP